MQELRELILFIDKQTGERSDIQGTKLSAKLTELYEGILCENWLSDEEAAAQLYPKKGSASSAYRKLKMTLRQRLIDILFTIDLKSSDTSDRQKAHYVCYKDWAAAKLLLGKGARLNGIEICIRILKDAIKYEFSDLCRDTAAVLRVHYGTMQGDFKKFEYYNDLYKTYSYLCQREDQAEEWYTTLTMAYVNARNISEATHERAKAYYEQLRLNLEEFDSYRLHLYGRLIQMTACSSANDHEGTLQVCQDAIDFFAAKDYDANVPLQIFYYQMLEDYIALRQYQQGIVVADKLEQYLERGTFNWFKYQELSFLLSTHTGRYERAAMVFSSTTDHQWFGFLPPHVQETWRIFEAYLYYLVQTGELATWEDCQENFRMGKFLNEIPVFSKDKSGMNISILTIQILFSLLEKQHGTAAEQIESIKKYCSRYLARSNTRRSYYFIKMLLQIPQRNFDGEAVAKSIRGIYDKLRAIPLALSNQPLEVEVIPYEKLWELALRSLEKDIYKATAECNT